MGARKLLRPHLLALYVIVLVGLGFRLWGITWGLYDADVSRRPHPDEWAIYWLFQWFDHTGTLNPCPSAGTQCFFDWGSVFSYMGYFAHLIMSPLMSFVPASVFGPRADPGFVDTILEVRIVSALFSAATVIVVYRLGSESYGQTVGLLAAVFVSLSTLPIQLAHFATPDASTGFLMSMSLLLILRAMKAPSGGRFAWAGVLVGLTTGSEYHMGLLAMPLAAAWILSERREARWIVGAYGCAAVAFLVTNPYALIEFPSFWSAVVHTIETHTVDGAAEYQNRWAAYGPSWLYVVRFALGYGVGFAFAAWLTLGGFWALIRRRKADLLLLSWIIPYFVLVSFTSAKFMRYSAPLIPPLAVLAGSFTRDLLGGRRTWMVRVPAVAAAVVAIGYSGAYDAAYASLFSAPDTRLVATQWLSQHAAAGSEVEFEQLPDGLLNLPNVVTASGYRPCFAQFQVNRLAGPMSYLMTDSFGVEEHPSASTAQVRSFGLSLTSGPSYRLAEQVAYTPSVLGMRFPIAASPHDWRYPDHQITVYRHLSAASSGAPYCYRDLVTAQATLYVPRSRT